MRFRVYGPFQLWRLHTGLLAGDKESRDDFWDEVDDDEPGLSGACGCYVFRIAAGTRCPRLCR